MLAFVDAVGNPFPAGIEALFSTGPQVYPTPVSSPNVYLNSDTLSDSTLSGLTLASGGPSGATDAEYTGTGAAAGANKTLSRVCAVTPGQTYVASEWFDPSQVTNPGSNVVQVGLNTADGLTQIKQSFVTSSTAGRYATTAWTCPTNLAPNSDALSAWTIVSLFTVGTGGPSSAADLEITGTGVNFTSTAEAYSATLSVTPGTTYTPSWWADFSQVTHGIPDIRILSADRATIYQDVTAGLTAGAAAGRYASPAWTCPVGVTSVCLDLRLWNGQSGGFIVASGQKLKFSQPMLEPASSASGYYISSQTPQVQVFAQLLSSAIVTSGQKFKLSQPMLAPSIYSSSTYLSSAKTLGQQAFTGYTQIGGTLDPGSFLISGDPYTVAFFGTQGPSAPLSFVYDSTQTTQTLTATAFGSPVCSQAGYTNQQTQLWPRGWFDDQSRSSGGIAYNLAVGLASELLDISQQQQAVLMLSRIDTSAGAAIESWVTDFFGVNLPRNSGETDAQYIARAKAILRAKRSTKAGVIVVAGYYGTASIVEPFRADQMGALGSPYLALGLPTGAVGSMIPSPQVFIAPVSVLTTAQKAQAKAQVFASRPLGMNVSVYEVDAGIATKL